MDKPRAIPLRRLADYGGPGATKAYEEVAAGRLKAKKIGHKSIVLWEDFEAWLKNLLDLDLAAGQNNGRA